MVKEKCQRACKEFPWRKKQPAIFWRGSSTGFLLDANNYRALPRFQLVRLSCSYPWLDAQFTQLVQGSPSVYQAMVEESKPVSPQISIKYHFAYKYLIDIDGNSCTYSRCRWILMSNSVLIKPLSPNIQWYYKTLQPFVHYVPVAQNLENLEEVYAWLCSHDSEAKKIAFAGQELSKSLFSLESVERYIQLLFSEYKKHYIEDL
ncbi:MAG: hypothetical protein HYZ48_03395 [Chlamydiales bacterium]|nr:hypothetical protein [Chlamydiales bacterium]